jgi:hypothetical protein
MRMPPFRAWEHLLRLVAVFAAAVAAFVVLRSMLVPSDYGELGPYRTAAVAQNRARPITFAGEIACVACHTDVAERRKTNAHARVSCESCHGPLAPHADDPSIAVRRPDPRATCAICHRPDAAKPPGFATVAFSEHADDGACTSCHPAHAPQP